MEINKNVNAWLQDGERGISSEAIVSKLTGINISGKWGLLAPNDPSDFKRCRELLKAVPEFRPRLLEMMEVSEYWKLLVENWDELDQVYLEECETGRCPKLYNRMKELSVRAEIQRKCTEERNIITDIPGCRR